MTITLDIELPDDSDLDAESLKWHLAGKLYDRNLISRGQAARMLGVTLEEFILGVGKYEVSVFQYTAEEVEAEVQREMARRAQPVE